MLLSIPPVHPPANITISLPLTLIVVAANLPRAYDNVPVATLLIVVPSNLTTSITLDTAVVLLLPPPNIT